MRSKFFTKVTIAMFMALFTAGATISSRAQGADRPSADIIIREGKLVRLNLDLRVEKGEVAVANPNDLTADIDVSVFNDEEDELDRTTIQLEPGQKFQVSIQDIFPDINEDAISKAEILVSLRPREVTATSAASLPIAFFSQADPRWASQKVGASGKTIKQIGCAMTSVTMAAASKMTNVNPGTMNEFLSRSSVGGYTSAGAIYWNKPPAFQPTSGFTYVGSSVGGNSNVKNATALKSLINGRNYVIAKSTRFTEHWVVIYKYNGTGSRLSDFEYLDPADGSYVRRTVDDGMVKSTSEIRVYK